MGFNTADERNILSNDKNNVRFIFQTRDATWQMWFSSHQLLFSFLSFVRAGLEKKPLNNEPHVASGDKFI